MRAGDSKFFQNISATTAAFVLHGGKYGVDVMAGSWTSASVKLQKIMGDGSTLISVSSATDFTANGYATVDLPPGSYEIVISSATGVYVQIQRIPGE